MNRHYNSIYGLHIKQYVAMKMKLGFKYRSASILLFQIDQYAKRSGETSPGITKEFAVQFAEKAPSESESHRYKRIRHLAQFSSYLCDLGIQSYIPKLPMYPHSTFTPYIYSKTEIDAIFCACDSLRLQRASMRSHLICLPALFRLLYSTGLRLSEALALTDNDVNLEENYLHVKDCKNGKERIIPISASLISVCKEYLKYRDQLPLKRTKAGYFFTKLNGSKCSAIHHRFKECLAKAGIAYIGRGHGPRIHDLRHTFAVTALASMAEAGIDLYASLPTLSNYLGHQSLDSTNNYVRLTANMYPGLLKDINTVCLDVFPKFKNYEAD